MCFKQKPHLRSFCLRACHPGYPCWRMSGEIMALHLYIPGSSLCVLFFGLFTPFFFFLFIIIFVFLLSVWLLTRNAQLLGRINILYASLFVRFGCFDGVGMFKNPHTSPTNIYDRVINTTEGAICNVPNGSGIHTHRCRGEKATVVFRTRTAAQYEVV